MYDQTSVFLKNCASFLYRPLHYLVNLSLRKHVILLEWCTHTIIPIFKSGNRGSVTHYRPISLFCNTSKVLEKLIYVTGFWKITLMDALLIQRKTYFNNLKLCYSPALAATRLDFSAKMEQFTTFTSS